MLLKSRKFNAYFNELLGEDVDTWLRENVQIYERRWCAADESTADLVEKACVRALENAILNADDIDLSSLLPIPLVYFPFYGLCGSGSAEDGKRRHL